MKYGEIVKLINELQEKQKQLLSTLKAIHVNSADVYTDVLDVYKKDPRYVVQLLLRDYNKVTSTLNALMDTDASLMVACNSKEHDTTTILDKIICNAVTYFPRCVPPSDCMLTTVAYLKAQNLLHKLPATLMLLLEEYDIVQDLEDIKFSRIIKGAK